jgi:hypothetical protein
MPTISPEVLTLAFLIQALIIAMFCRTLYQTILLVREPSRTIGPRFLWLLLIPFFEKFWSFRVITSISSSLHKEFTDRNFEIEDRPGYLYGMMYAVLSLFSSIIVMIDPSLILVAGVLNLTGLVFFVLYWTKINWYKKVLEDDQAETNSQ